MTLVDRRLPGAVIHDPEFRDYLETLFLDKGLRIVGAIYNSPVLMLSREPVTTLDGFTSW